MLGRSIWSQPPPRLTAEEQQDLIDQVNRPRQEGRAPLSSAGPTYYLDECYVVEMPVYCRLLAEALDAVAGRFRDLLERMPPARFDVDVDVDEPVLRPRDRALQFRRTRNTGPSRDLTRQRRPRQLL